MWLWSASNPAEVVPWAQATGVTDIFVYVTIDTTTVPWTIPPGELSRLTTLKQLADVAGIQIAALDGDPSWVNDQATALARQRIVLATGLFAGSHIDVEPYLLPEWNTSQATVVSRYLSLLSALQSDDPRPMEADVPFWYSTIRVGRGNLADAVLQRVSAVTVMSYRDTATGPNSIMGVGTDMLKRGASKRKPVRLAAETSAQPDCPWCTFFEEGAAVMTSTLAEVDTAASRYSSFAGIAIHHYDSWRVLPS
jgi:hypothetical protein